LVKTVPVMVMDDPNKIEVSNEPTRKQILRLISDKEMTLTQIARKLNLSKRSIAYHLRILLNEDLVVLTDKRVNEYGIQEKFYKSRASFLIGNFKRSSRRIKEEMLESNRDIVMGYLCARPKTKPVSDEELENLVERFTQMVQKVSEENRRIGTTRNQTKLALYKETFKRLENDSQWKSMCDSEPTGRS